MKNQFSKFAIISIVSFSVLSISTAQAQLAVTTFGATDARACYENANRGYSRDTSPCDSALKYELLSSSDRANTFVNRGIILNHSGDLTAAIDDFDAALEIDANIGEAYVNRGNSYFLGGQLDAALSDYENALSLNVSEPWAAWYNIGLVYDARNEAEKAREAYEAALEANPGFDLALAKLENAS